jgi:membrane protein DedA with SNARE-associated domain
MIFGEIAAFIVNFIGEAGYIGIIVMMFLESSFFPFPSEIVIPPAAYLASKGSMKLHYVILTGTLGSLLGAAFNYYLALKLGKATILRYQKYFFLKDKHLTKAEYYFKKHGSIGTFIGRLLPGVRQYISFPAGYVNMNIPRFIFFTSLGAGLWVTILAAIGFTVGNNPELVHSYSRQSLIGVIIFSAILFLIYYKLHKRSKLIKKAEPVQQIKPKKETRYF